MKRNTNINRTYKSEPKQHENEEKQHFPAESIKLMAFDAK